MVLPKKLLSLPPLMAVGWSPNHLWRRTNGLKVNLAGFNTVLLIKPSIIHPVLHNVSYVYTRRYL
jgi:hypothetical protein